MKKITILIFFLCVYTGSFSQNWFIDFESPQSNVWVDSNSTDSLWQIGTPQKTILDSAYSANKGIITDTINPYPINSNASFIVEFDFGFDYTPVITFKHKYDMDSLHSAGFIELSVNGGNSWTKLYDQLWYEPGMGQPIDSIMQDIAVYGIATQDSWYSNSDTIFDNNIGFTGSSNGWHTSTVWFPCYAVKQNGQYLLKFTFVSDSLAAPKDGWLIDDINIFSMGPCGAINEYDIKKIQAFPNPSSKSMTIKLDRTEPLNKCEAYIYDLSGKLIQTKPISNLKEFQLNQTDFGTGLYILEIVNEGKSIARERIIFMQ